MKKDRKIQLFSNKNSGHSYKVALMLELLGVEYERVDVALSIPREDRDGTFLTVSRFREVPVLVLYGTPICQSNSILWHLSQAYDEFGGKDQIDSIHVKEWLFWEANRIGFSISNLRFTLKFMNEADRCVVTYLKDRALSDLDVLDKHLSENKFLMGNYLTIADISCCGYLFWLHEAELKIENWPHVKNWLDSLAEFPRWQPPEVLLRRST